MYAKNFFLLFAANIICAVGLMLSRGYTVYGTEQAAEDNMGLLINNICYIIGKICILYTVYYNVCYQQLPFAILTCILWRANMRRRKI